MDDQSAQFFVAVGDLCAAANLAAFELTFTMCDGSRISGVPDLTSTAGDRELDDTGWADALVVGDRPMRLGDVAVVSVARPG